MSKRPTPRVSSRKQPRQARSRELVAAILEAATQVLEAEGAQRFTTARVAERAGISIGSLYQYFPNKASILFQLQTDEWQRTSVLLRGILEQTDKPPLQRLRTLVHAFIRSECEEAGVRGALGDAAPLYRDAPEAAQNREHKNRAFLAFMDEVLPEATPASREQARRLVTMTLSALGKQFSETPRTDHEINAWAEAVADMLCGYLQNLADARPSAGSGTGNLAHGD